MKTRSIIIPGLLFLYFDLFCQSLDTFPLWDNSADLINKKEWLVDAVNSRDSICSYIISKSAVELSKSDNYLYTKSIVHTLLSLSEDSAYIILLKSLELNGQINMMNLSDALQKRFSYPVIQAIKEAPLKLLSNFRQYIFHSGYLNKTISEPELDLLYYIVVASNPNAQHDLISRGFTENQKINLEKIKKFSPH